MLTVKTTALTALHVATITATTATIAATTTGLGLYARNV